MDNDKKLLLKKHFDQLSTEMKHTFDVGEILEAKNALGLQHLKIIGAQNTTLQKNKAVLNAILENGDDGVDVLVLALKETGQDRLAALLTPQHQDLLQTNVRPPTKTSRFQRQRERCSLIIKPLLTKRQKFWKFFTEWGIHVCLIVAVLFILFIVYIITSSINKLPTKVKETQKPLTDCLDYLTRLDERYNGIYKIEPAADFDAFRVYCDMQTGGWTIFQRRVDSSLTFWNRNRTDYKKGFDNGLNGNYWLGLDRLHDLTSKDENVVWRVDLWGDRCRQANSTSFNCTLHDGYWTGQWIVQIANETDDYKLSLSKMFAGNLSTKFDYFQMSNNMPFLTISDAPTNRNNVSCARQKKNGGWWHTDNCAAIAPNGAYETTEFGDFGLRWTLESESESDDSQGSWIYPIRVEMKLRPKAVNATAIQLLPQDEVPKLLDNALHS